MRISASGLLGGRDSDVEDLSEPFRWPEGFGPQVFRATFEAGLSDFRAFVTCIAGWFSTCNSFGTAAPVVTGRGSVLCCLWGNAVRVGSLAVLRAIIGGLEDPEAGLVSMADLNAPDSIAEPNSRIKVGMLLIRIVDKTKLVSSMSGVDLLPHIQLEKVHGVQIGVYRSSSVAFVYGDDFSFILADKVALFYLFARIQPKAMDFRLS